MSEKSYLTKEGLRKLTEELHEMKTKGRAIIAADIEEAREKGDLRENAEYKAAKERQSLQETKILKLENMIANAVLVDETNLDLSKVFILSTVKVKNLKTNAVDKYTLVPENEQNLREKKISVQSPVGKGLIGKAVGDVVEIQVPAGVMKFEVLDITRE
ncbi:MAG: transcription elongation factor GreA [Bacteroidia bacterium]|nr:transcription elongation factor GreA [Bacteroidia bacterium]